MHTNSKRDIQKLIEEVLAVAENFILEDEGSAKCGRSLRDILKLAATFCREGKWERAQQLCDVAGEVTRLGHEYRGAAMDPFFAIGVVHYYMASTLVGKQNVAGALDYFQRSSDQFKHVSPMAASSVWLGAAQLYNYREEYGKALWALQRSMNLLENKQGRAAEELRERIYQEYEDANWQLEQQMRTAPPKTGSAQKSPSFPSLDILQIFPIYGDLAAGSAVWLSDEDYVTDYVQVEHLRIGERTFRVLNLKDEGKIIRIESSKLYGLSKVAGNSMNNIQSKLLEGATIQDGDYVIFSKSRLVSFVPQDGEIIAAAIRDGTERRGVVKRYTDAAGQRILKSESTDPNEQSIPLADRDPDFIGQVIAVLKPVDKI